MRAVTFQSMERTSSPGWYSRTSANSMPCPLNTERYSPVNSEFTRPRVRSSSSLTCAEDLRRRRRARAGRLGAVTGRSDGFASTRVTMSSLVTSSASASYVGSTRWRSTSGAIALTSSGVTNARPRRNACARDACASAIVARGLAPNSISGCEIGEAGRCRLARRVHDVDDVVDDAIVHVQIGDARRAPRGSPPASSSVLDVDRWPPPCGA